MGLRDDLLTAGRRATEVSSFFEVRKRLALGYTRIDPALIASEAGVTLMYRNLERLLGGFLREDDAAGIIVNADRPRGLVHMTCAHELGHFFLGHDSTADDTVDHGVGASLVEQTANQFAYSLLAPKWLIASTMRLKSWSRADLVQPSVVYQMSLRLGTSFTAMVWSLNRLDLLSVNDAQRLTTTPPKRLKSDALAGGELDDAKADVWVLDTSDKDRILEPGPTDRLVFDLPNHVAAGHLWSIDDLRSEGFTLEPVVQPAPTGRPVDPVVVGGKGKLLRYHVVSKEGALAHGRPDPGAHRQVLAVQEGAPWQGAEAADDRFEVSYEAETIYDGFSEQERARRFATVKAAG